MKRVNKVSAAGIAAFAIGALLTGCGGGGSGSGTSTGSAVGGGGYVDEKTAVLSWSAPMTRENGDSISMGELEKYVIRYGKDAEDMSEEVVINNAQSEAEMSYAINGLENGTWYFTIQVQDTSGVMSAPSDVVSKSIQS